MEPRHPKGTWPSPLSKWPDSGSGASVSFPLQNGLGHTQWGDWRRCQSLSRSAWGPRYGVTHCPCHY